MNYRHLFHAGNFADVLKHAALALMLESLARKDTPFAVMDSHAGRGLYDLTDADALRSGEFRMGVARVMNAADAPAALGPYLSALRASNPQGGLRYYPGSPKIIQAMLRPQDRLILCEREPGEAQALRAAMGRDGRTKIHERDGYEALGALLPPAERRGLVLIDPPFEDKQEFSRLTHALEIARARFGHGSYMIWLPMKDHKAVQVFYDHLRTSGGKILLAELQVAHAKDRMAATALVIINPPWRLDESLGAVLPWLGQRMAQGEGANGRVRWLAGEAAA